MRPALHAARRAAPIAAPIATPRRAAPARPARGATGFARGASAAAALAGAAALCRGGARAGRAAGRARRAATAAVELTDVGANLLDPMFQGTYRGKPRHPADLPAVLARAQAAGVARLIVTAGSLQEAREAQALCAREARGGAPEFFCTAGVHPTRAGELEAAPEGAEAHLAALRAVAAAGRDAVVAVGECGLDYDRLQFCARDVQLRALERQLVGLAAPLGLPLFLHCRAAEAAADLLGLLREHRAALPARAPGVVHSFDGSLADATKFIDMGFYIGINGCSLRAPESLEVVRSLPAERLLLETDAPWCGVRPSHAGFGYVRSFWDEAKKPEKWEEGKCARGRSEPCHILQVLEIVAGCRSEDAGTLAAQVAENTRAVFFAGRGAAGCS